MPMPVGEYALSKRVVALAGFFGVFALLYPLTNLYSSYLSPDKIGKVAGAFDNHFAFIPSFIAVYNLSGVVLLLSFFGVTTPTQLFRHTHRLLLATLIGCLCFYGFPLRFSFVLPTSAADYQSLGLN